MPARSDKHISPRDPNCIQYWNQYCIEISSKLWLPDVAGLSQPICDSSDSWFSIHNRPRVIADLKAPSDLCHKEPVPRIIRSRKIRVYPTAVQRQQFKSLFGATRFAYNATVAYLKTPGTKANWMAISKNLMSSMPEWASSLPFHPKNQAINDACKAIRAAKKKCKLTGQFNEVRFRSKRNPAQNAYIPKTAVSSKGVYHTMFGKLLASEKIPKADNDCRLVLQNDRYFLIVPQIIETEACENQAGVIALDPGLRTFLVGYSERSVEEFGRAAFSRIVRLCYALDKLTELRSKATGARKRRLGKAQSRLRNRVKDSISELHNKVAAYLTRSYKVVVIPEFNFHPMSGKLFRKTVRGLATLAHGKFRQTLESHAEKRGCKIVYQNEAYTSKTCSACGNIQEIGSASKWSCKGCGTCHIRDVNGARGIFLRALRDTSWLRSHVACISGA